jgi:hypothetical protein
MNFMKIATVVLGLAFVGAVGCGSDGGSGGGTGGAILGGGGTGGAGGSVGMDAAGAGGALGTGGGMSLDAAGGAGGSVSLDGGSAGGSVALDANIPDASFVVDGAGPTQDGSTSEAPGVTNICTGLTPAACDLVIRKADTTAFAQDVPGPTPPSYLVCSAQ